MQRAVMTTSNSTNFSLNGTELMEAAMRLAGVLGIRAIGQLEMYNIAQQNLNIADAPLGKTRASGCGALSAASCFRRSDKHCFRFQSSMPVCRPPMPALNPTTARTRLRRMSLSCVRHHPDRCRDVRRG